MMSHTVLSNVIYFITSSVISVWNVEVTVSDGVCSCIDAHIGSLLLCKLN